MACPRALRDGNLPPIEGWLGVKADKSEFWKKLYVLYYQLFDNKYYKVGVQMAKDAITAHSQDFIGCKEKHVARDMIYCLHRFGYTLGTTASSAL